MESRESRTLKGFSTTRITVELSIVVLTISHKLPWHVD